MNSRPCFVALLCAVALSFGGACGSTPAESGEVSGTGSDVADTPEVDALGGDVAQEDAEDVSPEDVPEPQDVPAPEDVGGPETPTEDVPEGDADADTSDATDVEPDPEPDAPDPVPEICDNGIDDDLDGDVDERDLDCIDLRACVVPPELCEAGDWSCHAVDRGADCVNGTDDDEDGLVDCDDPDCVLDPACLPLPCVPGECGEGTVCDIWTGRCLDTPPDPVVGSMIGGACAADEECQTFGHSRSEVLPTCHEEWAGGYCMGGCSVCTDHWSGELIPRRECPRGSVCLPPSQFTAMGAGSCVQECTSDDDCRSVGSWPDYYCRRSFWVGGQELEFDNGYCAPEHCQSRGCSGWICGC